MKALRRLFVNSALILATAVTFAVISASNRTNLGRVTAGQSQNGGSKPSSPQIAKINYKIGQSNRISTKPNVLSLMISLAPEYFTRDSMVRLARQLNQDFDTAQQLSVDIFDDEKIARNVVPAGDSYSVLLAFQRGEYYLDRAKGYEYISFSTKRGKPANEVVVNFGRNRPRWLKRHTKKRSVSKRL